MSLIRLENITKVYSGDYVLRDVSFRVEEGEKIGLIGRNGTGKSTLFRVILGETEPEGGGVVERMRRARIAHLAQMPRFDSPETIFDVVMRGFEDLIRQEEELATLADRMEAGDEDAVHEYGDKHDLFAAAGGYEFRTRARRVLHGLGFSADDFSLPVHALSGGQRTRLLLALVLLQDADLLLLDEPENHLDLEAREWLESYIKESPKSVVIISHDRRMLNTVADRIVEVERAELRNYVGDYDTYLERKALYRAQHQKAYDQQREFISKETNWINRFRYKNTKANQVQSRLKRLEKLEVVDAPPPEGSEVTFNLGEVVRSGQVVLEARDCSMAYERLSLYKNLSLSVERGERVGIIGPNGCGKTTFLRQLAGRLEGCTGSVKIGHKVRLGFYEQHHENMNPANTILTEVQSARPVMIPEQVRTFMGRFLFTGDDIFKSIAALSGGELARVAIAKLILSDANVLLLDEPTNHLDIASREALEEALSAFPGSLVLVSHDRALVDRLVEKLIVMENGTASVHLGNYSDYRYRMADEAARREAAESRDVLRIRKKDTPLKSVDEKERRKKRRQVEDMERKIAQSEEAIAQMELRFAEVDSSDYERVTAMKMEYDGMKAALQQMYVDWEALSAELD